MLKERVLCYDTGSVIYLTQPGQPDPQLGNYIGDLTEELGSKQHYGICIWWTEKLLL